MTPAGNFFKPWDLPRLHPGRSTGSVPLENEGFLGLPPVQRKFWGFTMIVYWWILGVFRSKRVSEQSQIQFYQSYRVKNDTARFVSHTSQKNNLP